MEKIDQEFFVFKFSEEQKLLWPNSILCNLES